MLAFPGTGVLGYGGTCTVGGHEASLGATAAGVAMGSGPSCQKYQVLSL